MTHERYVTFLRRASVFFPATVQVSTKVASMKISKSGINKNLQELNKIKAVAIAGSDDKDNFLT